LIVAADKLSLPTPALFNAVDLFDKCTAVSTSTPPADSALLTAIACLSLSAKLESAFILPQTDDFALIVNNAFTVEDLKLREIEIVSKVKMRLKSATVIDFLRMALDSIDVDAIEKRSFVFAAVASLLSSELVPFKNEAIAAAVIAVVAASRNCNVGADVIGGYVDLFGKSKLLQCSRLIVHKIEGVRREGGGAVFKIYAREERSRLAETFAPKCPAFE
jgi:hypothetical protein